MSRLVLLLTLCCAACASPEPAKAPAAPVKAAPAPAPAAAAPAAPKPQSEWTVLDVALNSPDHKTLVAAVKAADLVNALGSPGGIYTVFAPTDAAFAALPAGTVEGLLKPEKKADLKAIVQHHAMVPVVALAEMKDGQTFKMADNTPLTVKVTDGKVTVEGANILGEVKAVNGVVYVVDKVILPGAK